jgi:hypothetical protein
MMMQSCSFFAAFSLLFALFESAISAAVATCKAITGKEVCPNVDLCADVQNRLDDPQRDGSDRAGGAPSVVTGCGDRWYKTTGQKYFR